MLLNLAVEPALAIHFRLGSTSCAPDDGPVRDRKRTFITSLTMKFVIRSSEAFDLRRISKLLSIHVLAQHQDQLYKEHTKGQNPYYEVERRSYWERNIDIPSISELLCIFVRLGWRGWSAVFPFRGSIGPAILLRFLRSQA